MDGSGPAFVLCGRRGTWRHQASFHVAGVALGDLSLCVAGVALGDMYLHFAWQAWHLWHWAGSGDALGPEWTVLARPSFDVAGVFFLWIGRLSSMALS